MLVRTAHARAVDGVPLVFPAEDRAFLLALARCGPFVLDPEPAMEYRVHAGQVPKGPELQPHRDRIYRTAIGRLPPGRERRAGERALRAGAHWRAGDDRVQAGRRAAAIAHYAAVGLRAPKVATSPLIWPALARGVLAALRPGPPRGERPW